jgi:ABC-2 type transport system permease protein
MMRAFQAELIKLRRPRLVAGVFGAMAALGILATVLAFAAAKNAVQVFDAGRPGAVHYSLHELAAANGPTRGFTIGAGFGGVIMLVLFTASVAGEFGNGTIRNLLLIEPRRLRVVAGKVLALAALVAAGFLVAELAATATAYIAANMRGISTSNWTSSDGIHAWISAYSNTTLAGLSWGLAGAAIGVVFRTVPIALAVALAWFFPFENILHNAWPTADRWFPGLLFQGLRRRHRRRRQLGPRPAHHRDLPHRVRGHRRGHPDPPRRHRLNAKEHR